MGTAFLYGTGGGGGSNLNFSVKTYATEEALLAAAPKENTIGVVTDTSVPKWGFYAAAPEVPAEGEIFFTVATESAGSFNALKKNALTVYPTLCQQSVSGEWVRKAAYIYKDGAWVQFSTLWNGELFEQGNVHADIIGGWAYTNKSNSEVIMTNADTDTIIECNSGSDAATRKFYSLGTFDFTEWNTLTAVMDYYATGESVKFGVSTVKAAYEGSGIWAKIIYPKATGTYNIDISTLSGSYYISSYSYGSKYRFSKIYVSK